MGKGAMRAFRLEPDCPRAADVSGGNLALNVLEAFRHHHPDAVGCTRDRVLDGRHFGLKRAREGQPRRPVLLIELELDRSEDGRVANPGVGRRMGQTGLVFMLC